MERYESFRALLSGQSAENTALRYFDKGAKKSMSYGELLQKIEEYPLPEEKTVGLFLNNTPESVVALFALAGRRRLVLLNPDDEPSVLNSEIQKTRVERLVCRTDEEIEAPKGLSGGDPAPDILFFTSGTTANNKAVVLDEKRLCSAAYNGGSMLPLKEDDLLLSVLPHAHVFGFVCSLLWPLCFGASVALGRGLKSIFFDFAEFRPTVTCLVPEMAGFLSSRKLFNRELSLILIGAGECSDKVLSQIKGQGIRVSYGYGLTETSSGVALSLGDDPRKMSVCPDYEITIAEDGEIVVHSSTTLMKGYFEDEEATRAVLSDNCLHTGDLGRLEDGKLCILGRKKEVLVLGDGTKIFLPDYEERLRSFLGEGRDFAVMQFGSGRLGLFIEKGESVENAVDLFNLENPRARRISKIVYLDALPKTASGKIKRYKINLGE